MTVGDGVVIAVTPVVVERAQPPVYVKPLLAVYALSDGRGR